MDGLEDGEMFGIGDRDGGAVGYCAFNRRIDSLSSPPQVGTLTIIINNLSI